MKQVYRLIFFGMLMLIFGAFIAGLYVFIAESSGTFWEYSSFEISDWLINYEGGFVRRGVVGQILYWCYQLHPYPVRYVIVCLCFLGFVSITCLLLHIFKKEGWSIFILPFTICLYYAFTCDLLWTRRDYWSLIIAFFIFYHYFKFMQQRQQKYLWSFFLLSAFTLLMHEASFFYTFPLLMLHSLISLIKSKNVVGDLTIAVGIWLPVLFFFLFIVTHKGDSEVMQAIWRSWEPCFLKYPHKNGILPSIGNGVGFLERESLDAILFHIRLTWQSEFAPNIPSWPFNFYLIAATYYLVTRLNTVDMHLYPLKPFDNVTLSNIMIVQLVCLIPMFGFLSCDLGRVIPYWTLSSLLAFYMVKHTQSSATLVPQFVNKFSIYIQNKIECAKLLGKPWFYCLVIITMPLNCYYGASLYGMVPMQYLAKVLKYIGIWTS